jgi:hypothetical protein
MLNSLYTTYAPCFLFASCLLTHHTTHNITQTYLIAAKEPKDSGYKSYGGDDGDTERNVFFRCGNWCYKGLIQFNGLNIGLDDLSVLIPALQKQQGSLRYTCNAKR